VTAVGATFSPAWLRAELRELRDGLVAVAEQQRAYWTSEEMADVTHELALLDLALDGDPLDGAPLH
jgi:hypothetical protein